MKIERSTSLLAAFAVLAVVAVWVQNAIIPFSKPFWGLFDYQFDLDIYRAGAQTVIDAYRRGPAAVFDGSGLYHAKYFGSMDFTYAPISIVFFVPFALLPIGVSHAVWIAGIFVALYLVIVWSFRSLGHEVTWQLRGIAVCLVVISTLLEPVRTTIWFGQINIFLMALVLWDLLRGPQSRLRGAGAGLAAGIKLTPLLFLVYLAATKQWRAAGTLLGAFGATIAVGFILLPSDSWTYWTTTLRDSNRVSSPQTTGNQSVRGSIANLAHTDHPNVLLWLLLAGLVGVLGLWAAVLAHRRGAELLALTLVGMTSCAVSPVSWGHHWVWLVPLLVIGIHVLLSAPSMLVRGLAGFAVLGGFLYAMAWRHHLSFPIRYVNQTVQEAWLTGMFEKGRGHWYRFFTVQPYVVILVIVSVASLAVFLSRKSDRTATYRRADGPEPRECAAGDCQRRRDTSQ